MTEDTIKKVFDFVESKIEDITNMSDLECDWINFYPEGIEITYEQQGTTHWDIPITHDWFLTWHQLTLPPEEILAELNRDKEQAALRLKQHNLKQKLSQQRYIAEKAKARMDNAQKKAEDTYEREVKKLIQMEKELNELDKRITSAS